MVLGKRNIRLVIMLAGLGLILGLGVLMFWPAHQTCHAPTAKVTKRVKVVRTVVKTPVPAKAQLLQDTKGKSLAASEIAPGRKVAVVVMKGTWCPVCVGEVDRLSARAHEVWGEQAIVAVVTDHAPDANAAFRAENGTPFPVFSDADYDQLEEWGLYRDGMSHPVPGVVFLDRDGSVEKIHRGRYPGRNQTDMIVGTLASY